VTNPTRMALAAAAALALWAAPRPAGASGVALKHVISVYADDAGKGLRRPEGVACTDDGLIVVSDTGNARLLTFSFKGLGVLGGKPITSPDLRTPGELQLDAEGNIIVLDERRNVLVRLSAKGEPQGKVELKGLPEGSEPPVVAAFKVRGATLYLLDGAGKAVLVADGGGNVTRRIPLPAGKGPFTDLAVDASGTIFAVDPTKAALWAAGKDAKEFSPLNEAMREITSFPSQLAVDAQGNLFVVDRNGGSLVQLGPDGAYQARHLGFGWADGQLQYPIQICVTADYMVVADRGNHRLQVFQVLR